MAGLTETLETIPGIGPVFSAGIIAEIGQIERFDDETKIAKYAGLYWRKNQSGRRKLVRLVDALLRNHQVYTSKRSVNE